MSDRRHSARTRFPAKLFVCVRVFLGRTKKPLCKKSRPTGDCPPGHGSLQSGFFVCWFSLGEQRNHFARNHVRPETVRPDKVTCKAWFLCCWFSVKKPNNKTRSPRDHVRPETVRLDKVPCKVAFWVCWLSLDKPTNTQNIMQATMSDQRRSARTWFSEKVVLGFAISIWRHTNQKNTALR